MSRRRQWTQVTERFWVGGEYEAPPIGVQFDLVARCAVEFPGRPSRRAISVRLYDDDSILASREAQRRAERAARRAALCSGNVAFLCAQGRNRSAFVAALALRMQGVPSRIAVGLIRRNREIALGAPVLENPFFVQLIKSWPKWPLLLEGSGLRPRVAEAR